MRLSTKTVTANNTGYNGLVKTLRQESPGHLTGFLIPTVPPTLSEIGRKRKVPVSIIAPPGHIHIRSNTVKAKKHDSLVSPSVSKSSVAFKRPSENRDAAAPIYTARKRKHSTTSGNADEDSAHSRGKRLAAAVKSTPSDSHGVQSLAPAHALPNSKDRLTTTEALPSRPPLEEIETWVPTPNAKFGPPKRKRTAGKRQGPSKGGPVDIAVPAKTPVPTPIPLPSLSRPLTLTGSQIVALREEEEESQSQSQPTSNQPGGAINDSTSGPLPPTVGGTKDDIQPSNPNVNNGRGSEPSVQGANPQSNVPDPIMQPMGVNDKSPGHRLNPPSPTSVSRLPNFFGFNFGQSTDAISSSKSSQTDKSAKSGPPRNEKPGASSIKQHSPSRSEPPRPDNGTLANRRALEARVRLDELRRAGELRRSGKRFGNIAPKGRPTLETPQSSDQASLNALFKRVMDGMESPNGSQVTHPKNSANEISASATPGGNRRADPSKSQEGLDISKSVRDVNMGSLSRTGGVLAANVHVVRGDMATRRTAPCWSQS